MDIDIMINKARNTHLSEMRDHLKAVIRHKVDYQIKLRNHYARVNSKKYAAEIRGCTTVIMELMSVWDAIDAYVKLEKR